ncbi:probable E3 ubiquitin-protein ligase RHG1A isoform X1 [Olea europaea var. sylvestris]|uniref:probable E3 ubiquitin-protein ligase RHG1A isoform X1 n=1 Tax=Olea europaea var. sylvestris TaxID=158386 RepID=UPI000C1D3E25|nr:probable E3 ubiquitin-protein ligase RHG1A isoform X1 [Olea europaea var. sylvestris]XP_022884820.1 probable E3 ubiquitin-protein ligase RHG1A isoform X1 [Olea europaea var. sylvestris]XP_022884821.1 probable E3 ubiquitin-protein ligase RHG1A isoform X1 [Olea europaea var. sylvestris]
MQGQRSGVSTLRENICFDNGSQTNDAGIDQQISWNNMQPSSQHPLPDYMIPSSGTNVSYLNHANQEGILSGWNSGVSSSNAALSHIGRNEREAERGWPSLTSVRSGPAFTLGEQRYEASNILSLNNVDVNLNSNQSTNGYLQTTTPDSLPQDRNISSRSLDNDEDCQIVERPNAYKSVGSLNEWMPSASSSSYPFGLPAGSGGSAMEEIDGRPGCAVEGRRLSCKRKVLEEDIGQSSGSGSSNYFHHAESSLWHALPAPQHATSTVNMSTPTENNLFMNVQGQANPRHGLGFGVNASGTPLTSTATVISESSRPSSRLRINGSFQQDSVPGNLFCTEVDVGDVNALSSQHSSRLHVRNNAFDSRSASAAENGSSQVPSALMHVPYLRRNPQSRWNRTSSSRASSSSGSAIPGERGAVLYEDPNVRNVPRNISEQPMFVPPIDPRSSSQNPTNWSLAGGNTTIAGNVAAPPPSSSSSRVNSSIPPWAPHHGSPEYPRRLSEIVRRSLLSSAGTESGGQSSNHALRSGSSPSQQTTLSPGSGNHRHHLSNSRSAMLLERHLDGAFRVPYSLRTLATASEGRNRLVSEQIRSVLNLMRRGEGLRFEDFLILDQSIFFGMADIHDRHRDMRLDVDNMSYEELLALEERIGNVCTGLNEETILRHMKQRKYVDVRKEGEVESEPCCICQEEYKEEADMGTLDCGHNFHRECVKKWLMQKNICPICKTTGLST